VKDSKVRQPRYRKRRGGGRKKTYLHQWGGKETRGGGGREKNGRRPCAARMKVKKSAISSSCTIVWKMTKGVGVEKGKKSLWSSYSTIKIKRGEKKRPRHSAVGPESQGRRKKRKGNPTDSYHREGGKEREKERGEIRTCATPSIWKGRR